MNNATDHLLIGIAIGYLSISLTFRIIKLIRSKIRSKGWYFMIGKNALVLNEKEMLRAINLYFEDLIFSNKHKGYSEVISIRQKGAPQGGDFILEIDEVRAVHKDKKGT